MIMPRVRRPKERIKQLEKQADDDLKLLEELNRELEEMSVKKDDAESECEKLKVKMKAMEEELDILRSQQARIYEKTKDASDKDAVIAQLILEKDRLAIENLKYHADLIVEKEKSIETLRRAAYRGWDLPRR